MRSDSEAKIAVSGNSSLSRFASRVPHPRDKGRDRPVSAGGDSGRSMPDWLLAILTCCSCTKRPRDRSIVIRFPSYHEVNDDDLQDDRRLHRRPTRQINGSAVRISSHKEYIHVIQAQVRARSERQQRRRQRSRFEKGRSAESLSETSEQDD